jgi:hypothetical protein
MATGKDQLTGISQMHKIVTGVSGKSPTRLFRESRSDAARYDSTADRDASIP